MSWDFLLSPIIVRDYGFYLIIAFGKSGRDCFILMPKIQETLHNGEFSVSYIMFHQLKFSKSGYFFKFLIVI